jgi:hypothetical protein
MLTDDDGVRLRIGREAMPDKMPVDSDAPPVAAANYGIPDGIMH